MSYQLKWCCMYSACIVKQSHLGGVAPAVADSSLIAGPVLRDTAQQCQVYELHVVGTVGLLSACIRNESALSEDCEAVQASSEFAVLWDVDIYRQQVLSCRTCSQ